MENRQQMVDYLATVRDLEASEYLHKTLLENVNKDFNAVKNRIKNDNYQSVPEKRPLVYSKAGGDFWGPVLGLGGWGLMFFLATWSITILVIFAAVGLLIGTASSGSRRAKEKKQYDEYAEQMDKRIQAVIEYNDKARKYDQNCVQTYYPQVVDMLERNLRMTRSRLQSFYDLDMLHKDYRNLVAICSIHQYLDSGRCDKLTGIDGAYNLYESELRANMIITKLDDVIARLDEMSSNQRELCYVLDQANYQLREVARGINQVIQTGESIQNSVELTNYNAECLRKDKEYERLLKGY